MSITDKPKPIRTVTLERRYTGYVDLKDFCGAAKEHDFIEVTTWTNHEGYDISIQHTGNRLPQIIQLTNGEFNAIKKIIKQLNDMP